MVVVEVIVGFIVHGEVVDLIVIDFIDVGRRIRQTITRKGIPLSYNYKDEINVKRNAENYNGIKEGRK